MHRFARVARVSGWRFGCGWRRRVKRRGIRVVSWWVRILRACGVEVVRFVRIARREWVWVGVWGGRVDGDRRVRMLGIRSEI